MERGLASDEGSRRRGGPRVKRKRGSAAGDARKGAFVKPNREFGEKRR